MKLPVNCFKCDKELEPVFKPDSDRDTNRWNFQPQEATTFYSSGQYGSTVWDPMSNIHQLMINICDECMLQFSNRTVLTRTIKRISTVTYHEWNPNNLPT